MSNVHSENDFAENRDCFFFQIIFKFNVKGHI